MSILMQDKNNNADYYIVSQHIKAYPCGSRTYFDPESRLNTEYNIRRSAALNGFKNSYVQSINIREKESTDKKLIDINFFVNGYYFEITDLSMDELSRAFGTGEELSIYAKISLADRVLYELDIASLPKIKSNSDNTIPYGTAVLTNQIEVKTPQLDTLYEGNTDNIYIFTGLSLSTERRSEAQSTIDGIELSHFYLPVLQYNNGVWEVPQTSLLPLIDHGETENSIRVLGDIEAAGKSFFNGKEEKDFSATDFKKITLSGENIELDGDITFGEDSNIDLQGDVTINGGVPTHCYLYDLKELEKGGPFRLTFVTLTAENILNSSTDTETDETQ